MEFLLSSVDPNKATGPDGISARMLKSTAASIAPAVTAIFNLSLIQGQFPIEWKVVQVIPIPKSEQLSNPTNYRPISLLSILSKFVIKVCANPPFQEYSPLSAQQWDFSKGKSTILVLYYLQHMPDIWLLKLERMFVVYFWT